MSECLYRELLYFDPSKPAPNFLNQIVIGISIMLFSNIIFAVIVKLFGKKVVNKIDEEAFATALGLVVQAITDDFLKMATAYIPDLKV